VLAAKCDARPGGMPAQLRVTSVTAVLKIVSAGSSKSVPATVRNKITSLHWFFFLVSGEQFRAVTYIVGV
jgi:hypothetical protein